MIDDIELSSSNIARCKYCGKKIGKGTPRGVEVNDEGRYVTRKYYCHKCTIKLIDEGIKSSQNLKKGFKKLIKQNMKAVVLGEL